MLVTFGDINVPASVKLVDPKNLAASFGPGYRLKDMTLEITDEAMTEGRVESVLTWLAALEDRVKPTNKKYENELNAEEKLYASNFKDLR